MSPRSCPSSSRRSSLRASSIRLCSRRASRAMARCKSLAGGRSLEAASISSGQAPSDASARSATPFAARTLFSISNAIAALARRILPRIVLALTDAVAAVAVPRARLLDDIELRAQIEDLALAGDAFAIKDVEARLLERRRNLVLDDLDFGLGADHFLALLDRSDAPDVEPHGGVELQRVAAGRRFRVAEHHADLHADLVDEDDEAVRALDRSGELAQRLRHQARLQPGQRVAHLAFDLGFWCQRRDGIDHDQVDRPGTHQCVGDLERLLAGVGLRRPAGPAG